MFNSIMQIREQSKYSKPKNSRPFKTVIIRCRGKTLHFSILPVMVSSHSSFSASFLTVLGVLTLLLSSPPDPNLNVYLDQAEGTGMSSWLCLLLHPFIALEKYR